MQTPEKVALYDRLGGVYKIATVVDDFIITPQEWQAFMDDLQQTLNKFNVPQAEQEDLVAIVESTWEAIVIPPLQENPEESKV